MLNKRIVNDAEFCGRVPLNQTNLIQPHGVLLVLKKEDGTILQCSENADRFLGASALKLIGQSISAFIPSAEEVEMAGLLQQRTDKIPMVLHFSKGPALALVHQTQQLILLELEEMSEETSSFIKIHTRIKDALTAIEQAGSITEACQKVAAHLKNISGFDKVMIYRFDADWNGEVIAEAMEHDMESYFGFTFPASDIPKQAREMYKRNPYRLIPDINYEPVKLFPVLNPLKNGFTDLTDTNLRSVAPVHIEYLRNMKVSASMSTRILKNGVLWGLIACHHKTPKHLPYAICSVFELLSDIISSKIAAAETQFAYEKKSRQLQLLRDVIAEFTSGGGNLRASFQQNDVQVLQLLGASGACFYHKGQTIKIGMVPSEADLQDLLYWMQARGIKSTYQTSHLGEAYDPALAYAETASGALVLPLPNSEDDCIVALRPEVIQEVRWGGNPDEAVVMEADGKTYHPRHSFRQWKETVRHRAIPWSNEEIEIAEAFGAFVNSITTN